MKLPGFYVTLQPNETGDTGSHQSGEIHIRKALMGDAIPDLAPQKPAGTLDIPVTIYNATRGEYGTCVYTYYGGRRVPESRLRRFPREWRMDWSTGDLLVFVRMPSPDLVYTLHHIRKGDHAPPALAFVELEVAQDRTHNAIALELHASEE